MSHPPERTPARGGDEADPWKETVRDIFDALYFYKGASLRNHIMEIIEERHAEYFGFNLRKEARTPHA